MADETNGARVYHPAVQQVLWYFGASHLPPELRALSEDCGALAVAMASRLPQGPELTVGLRKLLEAADCFVRAARGGTHG